MTELKRKDYTVDKVFDLFKNALDYSLVTLKDLVKDSSKVLAFCKSAEIMHAASAYVIMKEFNEYFLTDLDKDMATEDDILRWSVQALLLTNMGFAFIPIPLPEYPLFKRPLFIHAIHIADILGAASKNKGLRNVLAEALFYEFSAEYELNGRPESFRNNFGITDDEHGIDKTNWCEGQKRFLVTIKNEIEKHYYEKLDMFGESTGSYLENMKNVENEYEDLPEKSKTNDSDEQKFLNRIIKIVQEGKNRGSHDLV